MKKFQQNLLIALALCLCALCAYQWYAQTLQRAQMEGIARTLNQKEAAIQTYTNSIRTMDRQITQMDARISELKGVLKTNEQTILTQKREINNLTASNSVLANQVAQYKKAEAEIEVKLKESYDGIKKQNDAIKEVVSQRDEFVKKYNDSVKDRNEVVAKYNELVEQVQKTQNAGK
jgi:TolA-binding protein